MLQKCLKTWTEIMLHSSKTLERVEELAIRNCLEKFEFILLLCLESKELENIERVSKAVQKQTVGLDQVWIYMKQASDNLKDLRRNFPPFVTDAKQMSQSCNIPYKLKTQRKRSVKRFFDEIAVVHRFEGPKKSIQCSLGYCN